MEKIKTGVNNNNDPDSFGLDLDSGLGVFDGFFASLSMILVSEVSRLSLMIYGLGFITMGLIYSFMIGIIYMF